MNLILNSLLIQNYRPFEHFQINQLGRVNLFVGKNNVGKSSLLEALWIYAQKGTPSVIINILDMRDEGGSMPRYPSTTEERENLKDQILNIKHLFHGRTDIRGRSNFIVIGSINASQELLRIHVGWYRQEKEIKDGSYGQLRLDIGENPSETEDSVPFLRIEQGDSSRLFPLIEMFDRSQRIRWLRRGDQDTISSRYITSNGLAPTQVAVLWDSIALTSLEDEVVKALHIIAPEVSRLSFVGSPERAYERIPVVKIIGTEEPVPLRSMGEGMNRVLGLVLALVNAKGGMLLIDEIESGLHYSVQADIWRLVFHLSNRLGVQVFSTTHSWDCIQAFQQAAIEDKNEEAMLIRLENKDDKIIPTTFNERRLSIATREQIEVR